MGWNYTNKRPSQLGSLGIALTALGVVMLVFGIWHFQLNRTLLDFDAPQLTTARHRALALPAAFGMAVLIGGATVAVFARRQQRNQ